MEQPDLVGESREHRGPVLGGGRPGRALRSGIEGEPPRVRPAGSMNTQIRILVAAVAMVIPIADRHVEYANQVVQQLKAAGFRVDVDTRSERMQAKIRDAQMQKIPYMLVAGDKEAEAGAVAVRLRSGEDLKAKPLAEVIAMIKQAVEKGD